MKNIAVLTCREAADVCTGAACMKAFNEKLGTFAGFDEPISLVAFMQCNGCGSDPTDADMAKKLDRLEVINTDSMHIGICSTTKHGEECATISQLAEMIAARGIEIVRGTHP